MLYSNELSIENKAQILVDSFPDDIMIEHVEKNCRCRDCLMKQYIKLFELMSTDSHKCLFEK